MRPDGNTCVVLSMYLGLMHNGPISAVLPNSVDVCLSVCQSFFTWRRDHLLPLLEERGFEAVPGVERVRLVPGHELLHRLQDDTQLQKE